VVNEVVIDLIADTLAGVGAPLEAGNHIIVGDKAALIALGCGFIGKKVNFAAANRTDFCFYGGNAHACRTWTTAQHIKPPLIWYLYYTKNTHKGWLFFQQKKW
jgi:hypothetical protein